jgi:hypothetical protein
MTVMAFSHPSLTIECEHGNSCSVITIEKAESQLPLRTRHRHTSPRMHDYFIPTSGLHLRRITQCRVVHHNRGRLHSGTPYSGGPPCSGWFTS